MGVLKSDGEDFVRELLNWDREKLNLDWFKDLKDDDRVHLWAPFVAGFVKEELATMMNRLMANKHKLFLSALTAAEKLVRQFDEEKEGDDRVSNNAKGRKRERERREEDPEAQFVDWCVNSNLEDFEQAFPVVGELDFVLEGSLKSDYISKRKFVKQWFVKGKQDGVEFVVREVMDLFRMLLKGKGLNDAAAELKNSNSNIL